MPVQSREGSRRSSSTYLRLPRGVPVKVVGLGAEMGGRLWALWAL